MEGPPPARRRLLLVEVAVMAFIAAVPSFVIALEGIGEPTEIDLEIGGFELVASLLAALGPAAMAIYLLWRDGRLGAAGFDRRPASFVAGYGALGWVCTFIALYSASILILIVVQLGGGDLDQVTEEDGIDLTVGIAIAGLLFSLTAGFAEEVVFRAYAITRLEEAGYARLAIWAPWAVFTVVHVYQGLDALVLIGAVGAVFVWLYRWKRSVWPVMVAHAAYDITVLAIAAAVGS